MSLRRFAAALPFVALAAMGVAACSDEITGPNSIEGKFALVERNGEGMPFLFLSEDQDTQYALVAETLTFTPAANGAVALFRRVYTFNDSGTRITDTTDTEDSFGYTLRNGQITLQLGGDESASGVASIERITLNRACQGSQCFPFRSVYVKR